MWNSCGVLLRWVVLAVLVGVIAGLASGFFLFSLDLVTVFRENHSQIIWFLPLSGLAVGWLYHRFGPLLEAGNNLLLSEIHDPKATLPLRMAPLILLGTLLTHLFGGSAGREGTAVQMGGSLADQLAKPFGLSPSGRRRLIMVGMSAGFGSVFGVPFAGTIFGIEVLGRRGLELKAVIPCLIAAFVAHSVCLGLGIHHTDYARPDFPPLSLNGVLWASAASLIFGSCAWIFARFTEELGTFSKKIFRFGPLRALVGGLLVVAGYYAIGTFRYAGLGIPVLRESLLSPLPAFDWAWKFLFTALTLGFGFKGGEVTPLLFIGAALGNVLANFIPLSFSALAALGLVSVFAGAANTPLACAIMGIELFGPSGAAYLVLACFVSYWSSGSGGIYSAQRLHSKKVNPGGGK